MTPAQLKRQLAALERDLAEWTARKKAAKDRCDAINDPAELADALRDYLLALADLNEFQNPVRGTVATAVYRHRANDEGYRRVMACWWIAQRLMKSADALTGLTPAEAKELDERTTAEAAAFVRSINAVIAQAHSQIRSRA